METGRRSRRYQEDKATEFSRLVIKIGIGVLCLFGVWGVCAMVYMSASDNRPWPFHKKITVVAEQQAEPAEAPAETNAQAAQTVPAAPVAQAAAQPKQDPQHAADLEYLNSNTVWDAAKLKSPVYKKLLADLLSMDSTRLPADACGITQRDWTAFVKDNVNVSEKGLKNAYTAAISGSTFDVKKFWETAAKYRDPKNPRK